VTSRGTAPVGATVLVDVRDRGADLPTLMSLAGALTRHDAGLAVPYAVAEPGGLEAATDRVDEAVAALSRHGYDADGIVRLADSFESATVHLVEERSASMLVLPWSGPSFATDYLLGSEVDGIGRRSPVPAVAARVLRPWDRVVVAVGSPRTPWRAEDAALAFELGRRLAPADSRTLLVADGLEQAVALLEPELDEVDLATADGTVVGALGPTDVAIVPAYVVSDLSPVAGRQFERSLADLNLVVVAGAHRLAVSRSLSRRAVERTLPMAPTADR